MTKQANEIIEYKNEKFSLFGFPLDPYIENRGDVFFKPYSTANWRGYQGYWKLTDNKLFITNLESSNHSYESLFQTKNPILAEWFSGRIKFGFGNCHSNKSNFLPSIYDNYLMLTVENGIIKERKIIKTVEGGDQIYFGKYKGRYIQDLIKGKINKGSSDAIKNYIEDYLKFLSDPNFEELPLTPYIKINENEMGILKDGRNWGVKYFLTPNYVALSSQVFWTNSVEDEISSEISIFLEKILASSFGTFFKFRKKGVEMTVTSESSILLNPDLNYLNWALKNVETFVVPPDLLSQKFKLIKIKSFKINRLNSLVFEYLPVIEEFEYTFPVDIQEMNRNMFQKKYGLKYEKEINEYTYDLSNIELMDRFGFFLDENWQKKDYVRGNKFSDSFSEKKTYGKYSGTYAQDVEGLSDNYIDIVLDGQPDAYWNID